VAAETVVLEPNARVGLLSYFVTVVKARYRVGGALTRTLTPKARGPRGVRRRTPASVFTVVVAASVPPTVLERIKMSTRGGGE
jgi:hypothetical protein